MKISAINGSVYRNCVAQNRKSANVKQNVNQTSVSFKGKKLFATVALLSTMWCGGTIVGLAIGTLALKTLLEDDNDKKDNDNNSGSSGEAEV